MTLACCEDADDGLSRTGLSRALAGRFTIEPPAETPAQESHRLAMETITTIYFASNFIAMSLRQLTTALSTVKCSCL